MPPTPRSSEGKARAIRELSRELSHSPRSLPSLSQQQSDSQPTHQFSTGLSLDSLSDNEDVLQSTRQFNDDTTNALPTQPYIRSTAKKVGAWQPPMSEPPIDTSMVDKHFNDFDHTISEGEEDSIELARGGNKSNRSTPGRGLHSSFTDFNPLYDMTPPKGRTRKSYGAAETGNLRRDAQVRRASQKDVLSPRPTGTRNSPAPGPSKDRKRNSLAHLHAKVTEEDTFMSERPPTGTIKAPTSRFSRSRQGSPQLNNPTQTPQHTVTGTNRPNTATNATYQSFMLPDLPNLTELVSGVFQDGTPVFSKTAPPRHRFAAPSQPGGNGGEQPNHVPIDSVPIPEDGKAVLASLNLLREKVAQLEHERAEAEKTIEEQELEIVQLRTVNQVQEKLRGRDSALGSTDGEGSGGISNWKVEKTRLESSVQTLRTRLDRAERKLSVSEIANKRITAERDNLVNQLSVAFYNSEDLKTEKDALRTENDTLRQEVDSLRAENDELRRQIQEEQDHFRSETLQLRRQVDRAENGVQKENETLRDELARVRDQNDENTQNLARKDAELRKAKRDQAEFARLKAENNSLQARMASLKSKREQEARRWANRESELKSKIDHRDETIRHFQDMTQEQTNEAIRVDNENLRAELAQLTAQYENDNEQWAQKEERLRRKVEKSRLFEDMTREILHLRQENAQPQEKETAKEVTSGGIRKQNSERAENTKTRIATQVQRELRNIRSASVAQAPTQQQLSPQKPQSRIQTTSYGSSLPAKVSRSVSEPVPRQMGQDSDGESTTDLSLSPRRSTPYVMHGGVTATANATVEPPPELDYTDLSDIHTEDIANLRRVLEEERAGRKSAPEEATQRTAREDTVRSVASVKSTRQQSLPRRSSMKDVTEKTQMTEKTQGTVFEDLTGLATDNGQNAADEPTRTGKSIADASILSNSGRRRRSAPPVEMTSAFIIPDLTFHFTASNLKETEIGEHDDKNCTVCIRQTGKTPTDPVTVPKLVPASDRMPDEIDATLRPSRSPRQALALVVKELKDEHAHIRMEWAVSTAFLESMDVSISRTKRINEQAKNAALLKRMHIKADQIYYLYDVLEGQKADQLTEEEVEDITREILMEDEPEVADGGNAKSNSKGKKVTLDIAGEREESGVVGGDADGEGVSEDLPSWEGFESTNTGSVRFGGLRRGSRGY
ncbi:hypothetical protein GQ43DRAFT_373943 [Delitschia confertaspora ATCC 74209]|uniref:Cep57 centrosome microtubule-binding domain-containing protein n=1 Tax=Delitschia confertaspora ATCC 74209 TaxID=1513339 RepID=A0A9P4JLH5_9PLEO|nr:hypothetical protein GQ43DRAFT_373943 [Delitschia confertaspora ATCC 74209]